MVTWWIADSQVEHANNTAAPTHEIQVEWIAVDNYPAIKEGYP